MQPPVKMIKNDKIVKVSFSPYNSDLVEIMRDFNGWYTPKEKTWQFPLYKYQAIYDELKNRLYKVDLKTVRGKI